MTPQGPGQPGWHQRPPHDAAGTMDWMYIAMLNHMIVTASDLCEDMYNYVIHDMYIIYIYI